jgi:Ran GTPase-activating protein (RanGAP) involved in mRNA processing and transport
MTINCFIVEFTLIMTTNYSNPILEEQIDQISSHEDNLLVKLNSQKLTDQDMEIVVKHAIQKRQCTSLDLHDNEITSEGISILASTLTNNVKLHTLYLHGNRLFDKGIYELTQVLTSNNQTLQVLGLNSIGLTDTGAEDLAAMLQKNHTLIRLQLQANEIGDRGVQYLADALAKYNTTLEQLEMAENKFVSDTSVDFLVETIRYNRSLKVLDIRFCNISDSGKAKLQETIKSNKDLQLKL